MHLQLEILKEGYIYILRKAWSLIAISCCGKLEPMTEILLLDQTLAR